MLVVLVVVAGGGAGAYRSSFPEGPGGPSPSSEGAVTVADGTYAVTIGGGGARRGNGSNSLTKVKVIQVVSTSNIAWRHSN